MNISTQALIELGEIQLLRAADEGQSGVDLVAWCIDQLEKYGMARAAAKEIRTAAEGYYTADLKIDRPIPQDVNERINLVMAKWIGLAFLMAEQTDEG